MACCKVCCGCQDCTEGQEGKCCCGGPSGECCQTGEYCCSGACQASPCGCCLVNGLPDTQYTDQQSCPEPCPPATCREYLEKEDPESPCPDGWVDYGYCYRETSVELCDECPGDCVPEGPTCGKWFDNCPTCGDCISLQASSEVYEAGTCAAVPYFETEVSLPEDCPDGALVRIRGTVDDELIVDGLITEEGQHLFGSCNGAHNVSYDFTPSGRTFTVAAGDNYGVGVGYDLTICFFKNPFP